MGFNLEDYEEVKDRIPKFQSAHPDGRIVPHPAKFSDDGSSVTVYVELFKDAEEQSKGCPLAAGQAQEWHSDRGVNATSYVENCETSAIGRALANLGLCGKNRPSREEMSKAARVDTPKPKEQTNDFLEKRQRAFFAAAHRAGAKLRPEDAAGYVQEAKEKLKSHYNLEHFNEATMEQLQGAIDKLNEVADAH